MTSFAAGSCVSSFLSIFCLLTKKSCSLPPRALSSVMPGDSFTPVFLATWFFNPSCLSMHLMSYVLGVPVVAKWKQIRLVSMRMRVRSLASLKCYELWCRSQTQLESCIDVAVVQAGSCSSDLIPSLGTSIGFGCGPKKAKKQNKTKQKKTLHSLVTLHSADIKHDQTYFIFKMKPFLYMKIVFICFHFLKFSLKCSLLI